MDDYTFHLDDIGRVAQELMDRYGDHEVWAFYGEMGAGKTTLIKQLGIVLGVKDVMSSPSFAIINQYATVGEQIVHHFDFYRMKDESEALDLGIEDYFYSGDHCFIEWPERILGLLPEKHLKININLVDEFTRSVSLELP
ncbi:MAG: tRNA (adenosine(37)-N6)-threonylcarbamoyltransferase complex ATPase subunit type 1 TsaE [Bacteroidota bacterium]